ncbi:MAG: ethanolamine ammonia-lyase reactivating factor EutA [Hyphomicrobiales bacterium]|nr:ethanolamine ammonia-lyase reactivating factor EutA [Hyphomicrobiales bacterium]
MDAYIRCMPADDEKKRTSAHTATDHMFGQMSGHVHAPWEDADHDHDTDFELLEADSKALEHVPLTSIGIDIGSSGTQIVFSKLLMRGPGEPAAMRRRAKSRETFYKSPVVLTPFDRDNRIDIERLRGSLDRAYAAAGVTPDDIDTGVVIMTGAAARRDNAAAIIETLSADSGDIVTAAAGDHMEAVLAAYGSGAVERSAAEFARILTVDIGGATTKLAIADNGRVVASAALHGGGRQIVLNAKDRIVRIEPELRAFAAQLGVVWEVGAIAQRSDMRAVASAMADVILAALHGGSEASAHFITRPLVSTEPLADPGKLDGVMFSGGVAEYVYGRETRDFGDLGLLLGRAIAARIEAGALPAKLLPAGECIRATALGASQYSVQMSGATSCITNYAKLLPRRNLQVLRPPYEFSRVIDANALAAVICEHRRQFDDRDPRREVALAFRWRGEPDHARIAQFAKGIVEGLADRIEAGTNLYILIEGDTALTLGGVLRQELGVEVEILVIDGIVLRDFDYVDIGRIRLPSGMVPVTVKSLLFGSQT